MRLFISAGAAAALMLAQTATAALVARYTFDESSGTAVNVANPGTFDGTLNSSGITRSTDTPGGASAFSALSAGVDANGDFVAIANNGAADPLDVAVTERFTLAGWVKVNSIVASDAIMGNQSAGAGIVWQFQNFNGVISPGNFSMQLTARAPAAITLPGGATTSEMFTTRSALINGTADGSSRWMFLAATYDGTTAGGTGNENVKFYVGTELDSVLDANDGSGGTFFGETQNAVIDTGIAFNSGNPLRIGGNPRTNNRVGNVAYDDMQIYVGDVLNLAALEALRTQSLPEPAAAMSLLAGAACLVRRRRS